MRSWVIGSLCAAALAGAACGEEQVAATTGPSGGGGSAAGGSGADGGSGGIGAAGGTGGGGEGGQRCEGPPPPPQQGGTTYYVAPLGDDGASGTETEPFASIQHAADLVDPGDTVIVEDGVYLDPDADGAIVSVDRGGEQGNWVWLRARHRGLATLDGQANAASAGFRFGSGVGWVRIQGFEIHDVGALDGGAGAIECYNGGHDVELVQNHMHHLGRLCTDTDNASGVAIFVQQPNVVVDQNLIHDIGRFEPGEQGCPMSNLNYQNHDHGIYVDGAVDSSAPGASGTIIRNNVFYGHARGWAVQLYPGVLPDVAVMFNTFAEPNPFRDGHVVVDAELTGLDIRNNVFFEPTDGALSLAPNLTAQGVARRNVVSVAAMSVDPAPPRLVFEENQLATDPLLVDAAGHDYHLQPTSSAIDAADAVPEVGWDYEGNCRPLGAGFDVGAYER
jgi:hypothetical protein